MQAHITVHEEFGFAKCVLTFMQKNKRTKKNHTGVAVTLVFLYLF